MPIRNLLASGSPTTRTSAAGLSCTICEPTISADAQASAALGLQIATGTTAVSSKATRPARVMAILLHRE
jgi:hypothetical protein